MNFDAIKEQLLDRLKRIWGQISESGAYIELKEKYQGLSPAVQKIVSFGIVFFIAMFFLLIPFLNLDSSMCSIASFEESKQTIRDLLNVQREVAQAPDIPMAPPVDQIRQRVQSIFSESGLAPEQIAQVNDADTKSDPPTTLIPASVNQVGVTATLLKLNLKQVIDISFQLQNIAPNVFVTSMDMTANKQDNHYYDVIYRVVGFAVDEPAEPPAAGGGAPPSGGGKPPQPPKQPPGGDN